MYKEAWPHERAVAVILEGAGTQFDAEIIEAFIQREKDFAALAVAMAEDMDLESAVRRANAAAALSVRKMGAQSSIPTREEVDAMLS